MWTVLGLFFTCVDRQMHVKKCIIFFIRKYDTFSGACFVTFEFSEVTLVPDYKCSHIVSQVTNCVKVTCKRRTISQTTHMYMTMPVFLENSLSKNFFRNFDVN